jgi:hypothetical protein
MMRGAFKEGELCLQQAFAALNTTLETLERISIRNCPRSASATIVICRWKPTRSPLCWWLKVHFTPIVNRTFGSLCCPNPQQERRHTRGWLLHPAGSLLAEARGKDLFYQVLRNGIGNRSLRGLHRVLGQPDCCLVRIEVLAALFASAGMGLKCRKLGGLQVLIVKSTHQVDELAAPDCSHWHR